MFVVVFGGGGGGEGGASQVQERKLKGLYCVSRL